MAAANQIDLSTVVGTGRDGKITKDDVSSAIEAQATRPADGKVYAAPAARRTAREMGIDLTQVPGTGPLGRIQGFDVESYASQTPALTGLPAAGSEQPEVIPLIGMRRTIAERLTASYQSIPHIKFTSSVDMTRFVAARKDLNARAEKRGEQKVSATAFLVKLERSFWLAGLIPL